MSDARITQQIVEVLRAEPGHDVRVTQQIVEVLRAEPGHDVRVTQQVVEVLRASYMTGSEIWPTIVG